MVLFLKKTSLFICPILLLIFLFEGFIRYIPNDYTYKKTFLDAHSTTIQTLFLGSSHAYFGINPAYCTTNSFNASYVSQTLDCDVNILEKYDGKWDKLQHIVIPISYFTLFSKLETDVEAWRMKNYTIYYGFHLSHKIKDYSEFLSSNFKTNASKLYDYYVAHQPTMSCSELGFGVDYTSKKQKDLQKVGIDAAKRHTANDFRYFEDNKNHLIELIQFAKTRHIKVFLFTPPAYFTYIDNLNKTQLNQTIATAEAFKKSNEHVAYINFLNDATFIKSDFYDADHLNEIGAKKLTLAINTRLGNF